MKKIPVIIDCDPGHDDAIALILACASEKLDVLGVTTVGGNQTIEKTSKNALKVLEFIGKTIPVAKGADVPIRRELEIAPEVHGETGLDGPVLPDTKTVAIEATAVDFIAKCVMENQEKLCLIATGPLTNIAIFLLSYPELAEKIERISLMGGAAIGGNWSAAAEFNILVDPEAASIVFQSGIPITMAGLDVTHKARIYREDIEKIRSQGGRVACFVADLLDYFSKFHAEQCGWDFAPLHDPCAVLYETAPELFSYKDCHVEIDLEGEHTLGCTVSDLNGLTNKPENARVLLDIDREKMIELLVEAVNRYDKGGK